MSSDKCVLLFRASDGPRLLEKYNSNRILSISPYPAPTNPNVNDWKLMKGKTAVGEDALLKECIQYDSTDDVYFIDLSDSMYFKTTTYKWPESYTILLWIKWKYTIKNRRSLLVTFDSSSNSPVYADSGDIGCASIYGNGGRRRCNKFDMNKYDKWMFIAAVGTVEDVDDKDTNKNSQRKYKYSYYDNYYNNKKHSTKFYFGTLDDEVEFHQTVLSSVSGEETLRFGNSHQGPGKVSFVKVFDFNLDEKEIKRQYYDSLEQIKKQWNHKEINDIKKILCHAYLDYGIVMIDDIVCVVLDYCCKYPFAAPIIQTNTDNNDHSSD